MSKEPKPTFDPAYIRDISESVYRAELGADDTRRMIEKDDDSGEKLRNRAGQYDGLTRAYLKALGIEPSHGEIAEAVAAERERCAQIAEATERQSEWPSLDVLRTSPTRLMQTAIAKAIRALSEKTGEPDMSDDRAYADGIEDAAKLMDRWASDAAAFADNGPCRMQAKICRNAAKAIRNLRRESVMEEVDREYYEGLSKEQPSSPNTAEEIAQYIAAHAYDACTIKFLLEEASRLSAAIEEAEDTAGAYAMRLEATDVEYAKLEARLAAIGDPHLFDGLGMAMRREDEPPIPGEPLMSMADAKERLRDALRRPVGGSL